MNHDNKLEYIFLKVNISNKNGTLAYTLTMPTFGYNKEGEYEIKGINGNRFGKFKLDSGKGYIKWKENETIDVEFKALVLGSAFLINGSYGNYNQIMVVCSILFFVLGIIGFLLYFCLGL